MLKQVCDYIHNYFVRQEIFGTFTVENGMLSLPVVLEGQRIRLTGSVFNDNIYTYHSTGLKNDDDSAVAVLQDETFTGHVALMGIPADFLQLVAEISDWAAKYSEIVNSPYSTESVQGVYNYSKTVKGDSGGGFSWQDVFRPRLNRWRKLN